MANLKVIMKKRLEMPDPELEGEEPQPPGLTAGQLRSALVGVPDDYAVTIRTEEFCGGIISAAASDSCSGMHFAIDCSDDADDFDVADES